MTMGGCTNKEGREESTNRSPLSRVVSSVLGTRGTIGQREKSTGLAADVSTVTD